MFDWTISLGNLLTIGGFAVTVVIFIVTIRDRVDAMSIRLRSLEDEMRKLVELLIMQGRLEERLTSLDNRLSTLSQDHSALERKMDGFFEMKR